MQTSQYIEVLILAVKYTDAPLPSQHHLNALMSANVLRPAQLTLGDLGPHDGTPLSRGHGKWHVAIIGHTTNELLICGWVGGCVMRGYVPACLRACSGIHPAPLGGALPAWTYYHHNNNTVPHPMTVLMTVSTFR